MISVVLTDVQQKCLIAKKNEKIGKIKIKAIVIGLPSDPCASMSSNIFFPVHIVAHKITEITTKPTELIKTTIFFSVSLASVVLVKNRCYYYHPMSEMLRGRL